MSASFHRISRLLTVPVPFGQDNLRSASPEEATKLEQRLWIFNDTYSDRFCNQCNEVEYLLHFQDTYITAEELGKSRGELEQRVEPDSDVLNEEELQSLRSRVAGIFDLEAPTAANTSDCDSSVWDHIYHVGEPLDDEDGQLRFAVEWKWCWTWKSGVSQEAWADCEEQISKHKAHLRRSTRSAAAKGNQSRRDRRQRFVREMEIANVDNDGIHGLDY